MLTQVMQACHSTCGLALLPLNRPWSTGGLQVNRSTSQQVDLVPREKLSSLAALRWALRLVPYVLPSGAWAGSRLAEVLPGYTLHCDQVCVISTHLVVISTHCVCDFSAFVCDLSALVCAFNAFVCVISTQGIRRESSLALMRAMQALPPARTPILTNLASLLAKCPDDPPLRGLKVDTLKLVSRLAGEWGRLLKAQAAFGDATCRDREASKSHQPSHTEPVIL
jgi:hypothetical protein